MRKLSRRRHYIFHRRWPPPPPRDFQAIHPLDTVDGWCAEAIRLYNVIYDMMADYTSREYKNIQVRLDELYAVTPEIYKTNFHIIGAGAAYLGENILMVDGRLAHSRHCYCPFCKTSSVITRGKNIFPEDTKWCIKCDRLIKREWIINW